MLMLTLGTGVGGGLILGGRPYRGWFGAGAEIGHMVIVHDGVRCRCGGYGHLESYVSGKAADELAAAAFGPAADAHRLVRLAREGDAKAVEILKGAGEHLGSGIASLVNIFNPELIVIGGGFAAAGEFLFDPARGRRDRETLPPCASRTGSSRAELGTMAGLIGAAMVAFETVEAALMPLAVCATPIGNLEDVTLRVLRELAEADVVLCEDTRRTRVLLERHGIRRGSSATTSTTRRSGRPRCCRGSLRASGWRWSPTRGCRG